MAKWSSNVLNWTPVAVADTTNFTSAGFHALQGGSTTQVIKIGEVLLSGLAGASSPTQLIGARDSTVGATLSGGNQAALDPATAALAAPPTTFTTATTKPQRSSTLQLFQWSFNAFGGLIRWVAAPFEEIGMLGNAASFGEFSLSSGNGGTPGSLSSTIIFEPSVWMLALGLALASMSGLA